MLTVKKSPLSKKFDVAHGVDRAGCRISERTVRFNNSKQKHKKFLNFHQNSLENEINSVKSGVAPTVNVTSHFRSILTSDFFFFFFGFCSKFLATLNKVSLINLTTILCCCFFFPM